MGEGKVNFGALIIGPSGSGKSTLCDGFQQLLSAIKRDCCIINLDPANESPKYQADISLSDLISLDEVMESLGLGPNGGLIYCMEFLDKNFSWLEEHMLKHQGKYMIIDLPGQLELFLNSDSMRNIIEKMKNTEKLHMRITAVELFDAQYIMDKTKYMSACLYSLVSMINLSLPHLNVLSKSDLLTDFENLDFKIDFYLESNDFETLSKKFAEEDSKFAKKYTKLTSSLCQLLENYGMNDFFPLDVMDQVSVSNLLAKIDKCSGFSITASGEEQTDLRDRIFEQSQQGDNVKALTKFQEKVEEAEEDLMKKELLLFEKLAKGEITEDQMYAMLE